MLDAHDTLSKFMVDGMPSWERFRAVIGPVIESVAGPSRRKVRAYGEMVDVLWQRGEQQAAICLEEMWNDLRHHHDFNLLCAYANDSQYSAHGIAQICGVHTHVEPRERVDAALQEMLAEALRAKAEVEDFLENAVLGIHRVDKNGIITWANATELQLLGYSREEYVGHNVRKFHVDEPVITDILTRLQRGETLHDYPVRLRAKDGSIKHVELSSNARRDNGELYPPAASRATSPHSSKRKVIATRSGKPASYSMPSSICRSSSRR